MSAHQQVVRVLGCLVRDRPSFHGHSGGLNLGHEVGHRPDFEALLGPRLLGEPFDEIGVQEAAIRDLRQRDTRPRRRLVFIEIRGKGDPSPELLARLSDLGWDILPLSAAQHASAGAPESLGYRP